MLAARFGKLCSHSTFHLLRCADSGQRIQQEAAKAQIILVAAGSQWLTDDCPKPPGARPICVEDDKIAGPASDLPIQSDLPGTDQSQSLGHPQCPAITSYQKNGTVDMEVRP